MAGAVQQPRKRSRVRPLRSGPAPLFIALALIAPVLTALFIAVLAPPLVRPAEGAVGALNLSVRALPLNPEDKAQQTVGALIWRGGLVVTTDDRAFGGLSDLVIDPAGREILAVSDSGRWLSATLSYDGTGHLSGMTATRFGHLRGVDGAPLQGKRRQDAEALTRLPDGGGLVVGYERDHRFRLFPSGDDLVRPPQALAAPPRLAAAALNSGVEALVALADGRLLAFTESQAASAANGAENYAVYRWKEGKGWAELALKPAGLFRPTGAALLPGGDVLLLERRFTLLGGVGIRLRLIPAAAIGPGAVLTGREIAELRLPLTVDNFEGIAVHQTPAGATRLTLISDDNFNALQRTLIVQFELAETP